MVLPKKITYKSLIRFYRTLIYSTLNHFTQFLQGQALIEIMIALGMALLIITGFMSVMNTGLTSSTFATEKVQSVSIAKEGLEKIRWFRDAEGWNTLSTNLNNCIPSCTDIGPNPLFSTAPYNTSPSAPFSRIYKVTTNTPTEKTIKVTVSWPTRNGTSTTDLYTIVTNWRYP